MLNAKIFYIFLCLIVIETTGLLLLKRGLEMGYLDTEAIILAVFSFAFYNFFFVYYHKELFIPLTCYFELKTL
ncbi:hypothetical protein AKI51_04790 [Streptococcus pneumoniae]|uniref:hypothetical protein n=1 Tax=Streptococcus pneumoniae TaxID=1313 RepID=UPI000778D93C|nr:hypothetical protein [Streptococcus pneumoniae]KXZ94428.1 hypothetical protein AKI51_04790 [Streptococcus pneumoniae]